MIKRSMLLACTSLTIVAAFENEPGWKMDGDKLAVDDSGDPIYIDSDGKEASVKHDAIGKRNREAQQHRERAEKAEGELAKYRVNGALIDPIEATKAIETVKKIDAKQLIDAGEVDKVRDEIKGEFTTQLTEKDNALAERDKLIDSMRIDGVFKSSEFINAQVAMPRDFFEAAMRDRFKVEDGKVVAYDRSGNRLMSKKNAGEYADTEEALQLLVDQHPQKDTILKAPDAGGSGNNGGGGNRGRGRVMRRADFDQLDPGSKAAAAQQAAKGELTIAD